MFCQGVDSKMFWWSELMLCLAMLIGPTEDPASSLVMLQVLY